MRFNNPLTGLTQHFEMEVDTSFMEVKTHGALPAWKSAFQPCDLTDLRKTNQLQDWLPLDLFSFEGLTIIRIKDVTPREVISNIKNIYKKSKKDYFLTDVLLFLLLRHPGQMNFFPLLKKWRHKSS